MSKVSESATVFNSIVLLASIIGALIFFDEIRNLVATVDFHHEDSDTRQEAIVESLRQELEPIAKSANAAESNSLPPRIRNLLILRCKSPGQFGPNLQELLDKQISRYEELNDREYTVGTCDGTVYVNSIGVRYE